MAIYGTPLTMGGGGGGQNETLPPLLDNFKATRLEGGIVPPTANTLAFKDIPDGSKIKLVKSNNISGTVTYGTTTDLNHRIVFDSNDWTKKEFKLENDIDYSNISGSDIDQWLNATKASGWWTNQSTNTTSPDYANEQGFLYQLGITDEVLAQNFNDININATAKAKVGLPWTLSYTEEIPYTFFKNISLSDFGEYARVLGDTGDSVDKYDKSQAYTPKAPDLTTIHSFTGKIHPMMEPKPETKVALDVDGSYFMFEDVSRITLSADKMPISRANALAGAVWVYGEHEPKNVNDGTKIELTRDEVIKPDFIPPITLADVPVSDADTETVVNLKESDGKLYPYLYLSNNHNSTVGGLLLRKNIGTVKSVSCSWKNNPASDTYRYWCENEFMKKILDPSVSSQVINGNIKASFSNSDSHVTEIGSVKCFALSMNEYGLKIGDSYIKDEGPHLPYFSNDKRRIAYNDAGGAIEHYTRTTVTATGYMINTSGQEGYEYSPHNVPHGLRPAIFLPLTFKLNATPNPDGSYDMYEESSAQTLATGKTIADLPSKSKVKLGRYGDADLQWLVSRNAENKLFLILAAESMSVLETKMFDNAEPSNPNGDRASNGNNKYSLSNIHQWLNSDKSANSWYTKSHTYDASPDYTNLDGFLAKWTNAELQAVLNTTWTTTTAEVDGDNTETFQSKITLPSTTEMNLESNTGGSKLDIFDSNEDRTIAGKYYWCRTPFPSKPSGERMVDIKGKLSAILVNQTTVGVRPICSIPETTLVSDTPDSDGCYTLIAPPLERTVAWDKSKNFYARQFTYNNKKQYQTMLEGAIAYLPIMPDGQELSKLPSKSKVKLGKFNGTPLKWLICRDSVDQSLRLILDGESVGVIGNKTFDNKEPSNSDSDRRNWGNNRYIWSNIRQWLNSSNPANGWYSSQHSTDAPPDYTNVAGFLHEWTEKEISVLENASWVVTRASVDGGGSESFQNKIVLPSTTEMGLESGTGGARIDIFNNNEDRVVSGVPYWCRTPHPSFSSVARIVDTNGTITQRKAYYTDLGVRPLCKPLSNTLVSIETDSEGCFTLV